VSENAVALGATTLLIVPSRSLNGQGVMEARRRLVDSIATISPVCAALRYTAGLEPANRMVTDLVNTAGEALEMIAGRDPSLGVVLDSGHINLVDESAREAIEKLAGRLLQVHVNDNDGITQQNLIPGDGNFDFGKMLLVLKEAGTMAFVGRVGLPVHG
jgi:sugar phosphate isomerase/epimerase